MENKNMPKNHKAAKSYLITATESTLTCSRSPRPLFELPRFAFK